MPVTSLLPASPDLPRELAEQIGHDWERFARDGLPDDIERYLREAYGLDVASSYAGLPIKNPWGKASGQLSMTPVQVAEDADAGVGFCVLKTVIAQDAAGEQSMRAWAIPEARMVVERIRAADGDEGWTVSWKGRGWAQPFADYLALVAAAQRIGQASSMLIVPSCKFHLPGPGEDRWRSEEYAYTTRQLLEAYGSCATGAVVSNDSGDLPGSVGAVPPLSKQPPQAGSAVPPLSKQPPPVGSAVPPLSKQPPPVGSAVPPLSKGGLGGVDPTHNAQAIMPLEKDFSPTLAGSDRATSRQRVLEWLREVPRLVRQSCDEPARVRIGLKLFNALFDDDFQLDMLQAVAEPGPSRPDFVVYGNRLFDPAREFEGARGIAVGGPALSARNLRVLSRFLRAGLPALPELSATGNICSGKMAVEYLLRGATSFQLHTFFQLPASEYTLRRGTRTAKALHQLYWHPASGLVAWLHHVAGRLGIARSPIRLKDLVGAGPRLGAVA